jgi:hypothetical protein
MSSSESRKLFARPRTTPPDEPSKRAYLNLAINVPASLDVVEAHREIWYAVMGHAHTSGPGG